MKTIWENGGSALYAEIVEGLEKKNMSTTKNTIIWLIVVARMLLPFAPKINFVGTLFQYFDNAAIQTETSPLLEQEPPVLPESNFSVQGNVSGQVGSDDGEQPEPDKLTTPSIFDMAKQNVHAICLMVWLLVTACLLIRKVTVYQNFVKYQICDFGNAWEN